MHTSCSWGEALNDFIISLVTPCLQVQASSWSGAVVLQASEIAAKMTACNLSSIDDLNLKLGSAVACGVLNEHPLVQGILVAAIEQAQLRRIIFMFLI